MDKRQHKIEQALSQLERTKKMFLGIQEITDEQKRSDLDRLIQINSHLEAAQMEAEHLHTLLEVA